MMIVGIILDVLICAVAIFALILGVRRGLIWICFRKFRKIVAVVVSVLLAKPLGQLFTNLFLGDWITKLIMSWAQIEDTAAATPEEMISQLPTVVKWVAELLHLDVNAIAEDAYASGQGMYYQFISETSLPIARIIGVALAWIILFVICLIALRILLSIGTGIAELPVLKQVNALLGGCASLLFYGAIVWCAVRLLGWLSGLSFVSDLSFMQEFSIENTHVAKYIYAFQPLAFILSL